MRFYEFEARGIAREGGVPSSEFGLATSAAEARGIAENLDGPVVIKSQVLSGGRMKAGGVRFAKTPKEAFEHAEEVLALEINGFKPRAVLVDRQMEVAREYYAGVTWDQRHKRAIVIVSDVGGIDIEEVARTQPQRVARAHLSARIQTPDFVIRDCLTQLDLSGRQLTALTPIVTKLARLFFTYDLTLAELNPLAELKDGSFVALDAHMELENEARLRQAKLLNMLDIDQNDRRQARATTPFELTGAQIDASDHRGVAGNVTEFDGNLGLVIGAGGGSLTLFDAVTSLGGKPANYCEIGGNPSVRKVCALTKLVLSKPGVDRIAVMMSIVSNTRVDIVARGVIKACVELGLDPSQTITIFRIPGAWEDEGFKILEHYGVEYADRSVSMHEAAKRAVEKAALR